MSLDGESVGELVRWFGHDAVIFGGNSGGPLVDTDGRIAGINEIGVGSLGGAIPANTAKAVAAELIKQGRITRGWTGVEVQPLLRSLSVKDVRGVLVRGALEGSPAAAAGFRQGDIITSVAGQEVSADCDENMPAYHRLVSALRPGVAVPFVVRRGDQGITLTVTPLAREANEARELELTAWGLTVRNLTRMSALYTKRPDTQGVMVDSLRPGGPSAEAKPALMDGDIILTVAGRPVATAAALRQVSRELLQDKTEPESGLVGFARGSSQMLSVVRVGPEVDPAIAPRAPKPWAGVSTQVLTAEIAKALNLKGKAGVRITQVLPNSNAEKAGLKVGDLLVKLDGKVIPARRPEDSEVFAALLREYPVGTDVALDVLRDGQARAVLVESLDDLQAFFQPGDQVTRRRSGRRFRPRRVAPGGRIVGVEVVVAHGVSCALFAREAGRCRNGRNVGRPSARCQGVRLRVGRIPHNSAAERQPHG